MTATAAARRGRAGVQARPGAAHQTLHVSGPADPDRVLTLNFDAFVDALKNVSEPLSGEIDGLAAGADLLLGIMDGALDFGSATPGAPPRATLAERLLALTDGAFEHAHRILEQDGYDTCYLNDAAHEAAATRMRKTLKLLDYREDPRVFEQLADQLRALAGVEDRTAAGELL